MPVSLTIVSSGTRQAYFRLTKYAENINNPRPAMEEIYFAILEIIGETFEKEGAREGFPKWEPLTWIWARTKAKKKPPLDPRILRATGHLFHAMTSYRHPDVFTQIQKDRIVHSPRAESLLRGRVHQTGSPKMGIPARPFVRFSKDDQVRFAKELMRHIVHTGQAPA